MMGVSEKTRWVLLLFALFYLVSIRQYYCESSVAETVTFSFKSLTKPSLVAMADVFTAPSTPAGKPLMRGH